MLQKRFSSMERIFFPIVAAVVLFGPSLRGKRIIVRTDNEAVVSIVNRQTSKCPEIMKLLRFVVLQCLKNNVAFSARHIPGCENNVADALIVPLSGGVLSKFSTTGRAGGTSGSRVSLEPLEAVAQQLLTPSLKKVPG